MVDQSPQIDCLACPGGEECSFCLADPQHAPCPLCQRVVAKYRQRSAGAQVARLAPPRLPYSHHGKGRRKGRSP
jgi:hypothetical protein